MILTGSAFYISDKANQVDCGEYAGERAHTTGNPGRRRDTLRPGMLR